MMSRDQLVAHLATFQRARDFCLSHNDADGADAFEIEIERIGAEIEEIDNPPPDDYEMLMFDSMFDNDDWAFNEVSDWWYDPFEGDN